ncbi:hypothetical protein CRUP_001270 [Coryphaenoides rupestris]|nr:hypothetical protein CRUP_001270 [Coryphaenoides rupestris]
MASESRVDGEESFQSNTSACLQSQHRPTRDLLLHGVITALTCKTWEEEEGEGVTISSSHMEPADGALDFVMKSGPLPPASSGGHVGSSICCSSFVQVHQSLVVEQQEDEAQHVGGHADHTEVLQHKVEDVAR